MPVSFRLIFIILSLSAGLAFLIWLIQVLIVKVNVSVKRGNGALQELMFLKFGSNMSAADVKFIASPNDDAIGHVAVKDGLAWVEISSSKDAAGNVKYRKKGYVDSDGFIYEFKKGSDPKRIGYLAKPSHPNEPTIEGERNWREFWLVKSLNVYLGDPGTVRVEEKSSSKKRGKGNKISAETDASAPDRETVARGNELESAESEAGNDTVAFGDLKLASSPESPGTLFTSSSDQSESKSDNVNTVVREGPNNTFQSVSVRHIDEDDYSNVPLVEVTPKSVSDSASSLNEDLPEIKDQSDSQPDEQDAVTQEPNEESSVVIDEVDQDIPSETEVPSEPSDTPEEKAHLEYVTEHYPYILDEIRNQMIFIEGGTFRMGADAVESESGHSYENNESPVHNVTLSPYYMGMYPVTQRVWTAVMGYNNSAQVSDNYPVAPVNWDECDLFVRRLSKLTGHKFMLPTEAQWEYAARGGSKSKGFIYSGSNDFSEVGSGKYDCSVGTRKPNELGLYDMSGLVREWTGDWYLPYTAEDQCDPRFDTMPEDPECRMRAVRSPAGNCTVTNRKGEWPTGPSDKDFKSYGFRVVCECSPEELNRRFSVASSEVPVTLGGGDPLVINPVSDESDLEIKTPAVLVGKTCKRGVIGGGSLRSGYTDEAKGGVFAAFSTSCPSSEYEEFISDSPYGWLDTALLSAMVFSCIYMALYLINSVIYQFPMYDIDHPRLSSETLTLFYFIIWFIVRTMKVGFAESGNSIQPQLDLFNRSRGVLAFDIITIIIALICWFDWDFIPVARALLIGVVINLFCRKNRELWTVINPFHRRTGELDDSDDNMDGKLLPPEGNDMKEYKWELDPFDSIVPVSASCVLRYDLSYIEKLRMDNPFYMEMPIRDYKRYVEKMRDYLISNDTATYHTRYLAQEIKYIAERNKLSELDTAQFVLDFVQKPNIEYVIDKDSINIAKPCEYMRYPDETLYDKEGDCDCKAFLAFMLYHYIGFDVMLMLSSEYEHAAIGLSLKNPRWKEAIMTSLNIPEDKYLDFVCEVDGKKYIYCETTNDHFKVGQVPAGESITKFDKKIELLCDDEDR